MAMTESAPQAIASLERLSDGQQRFRGCSRIQDYEFISKLGEGTFGEVSKARSKKTGQIVALKKILMHNEKDGFPITALREIKLLKQLDHLNILKLEEMAIERPKDVKKKPSMFMVTPYMDHDLSGLLENPSVTFTEPQIKCYMKQLLEGCRYLHENRILHRDMKAANLLISNRGILQIADFGLARPYDDEPPRPGHGGGEATREYTTLVVTRWYRPPELLLQLRRYTTAIDMWGVGCVFGEMFKGKPILAGNSDLNQAQLIFDLVGSPTEENMPGWSDLPGCEGIKDFSPRPSTLDREFQQQSSLTRSLLSDLLTLDWRRRINAIDSLNHPYFHTQPLPARPEDLPSFEESHELDRRKFRDQKAKPPPAPAGGSVGVGVSDNWNFAGRGQPHAPPYRRDGPAHLPHQNGDYRAPRAYDGPPLPPHNGSRVPPMPRYEDPHTRWPAPPQDLNLPPRPPPHATDPYRQHNPPPAQTYRDENRGPPPRRPPPHLPDQSHQSNVDTYIPDYSNADPQARPPRQFLASDRRERWRDDNPLPRHLDGRRDDGPPIDYGQPQQRHDDNRVRDGPGGGYDRRRSRSPRHANWQPPTDYDRYRRQ